MGQLAAGIAHEVNNPLGVVLMYAHFLAEQLAGKPEYREDLAMIVEQADRCKKIVAGLLDFARQNKVEHDRIHIDDLVQRGLRGLAHPLGVEIEVEHAVSRPARRGGPRSDHAGAREPRQQRLRRDAGRRPPEDPHRGLGRHRAHHRVGHRRGHPAGALREAVRAVLHDEAGAARAPGWAWPSRYGIVKMHRGDIKVASNADPAKGPTGTTFTVILPRRRTEASPAA